VPRHYLEEQREQQHRVDKLGWRALQRERRSRMHCHAAPGGHKNPRPRWCPGISQPELLVDGVHLCAPETARVAHVRHNNTRYPLGHGGGKRPQPRWCPDIVVQLALTEPAHVEARVRSCVMSLQWNVRVRRSSNVPQLEHGAHTGHPMVYGLGTAP
jgi:hypothetical protein